MARASVFDRGLRIGRSVCVNTWFDPQTSSCFAYGHGHAGTDLSVMNNILFKEPFLVTSVGASGGFELNGRPSVFKRSLELIENEQMTLRP